MDSLSKLTLPIVDIKTQPENIINLLPPESNTEGAC